MVATIKRSIQPAQPHQQGAGAIAPQVSKICAKSGILGQSQEIVWAQKHFCATKMNPNCRKKLMNLGENFFLEITLFWDEKSTKIRQIQSENFFMCSP